MPAGGKLKVYDDGQCPFCVWAAQITLRLDTGHKLEFRDYNDPAVAAETPYTLAQLAYRMHVQTPDGRWHEGYWAWLAILMALPKLRWLPSILRRWPARRVGPPMYQFVANHRYRIPAFLLRWLKAPAPCPAAGCAVEDVPRRRAG